MRRIFLVGSFPQRKREGDHYAITTGSWEKSNDRMERKKDVGG
jgi:hypothetical protein